MAHAAAGAAGPFMTSMTTDVLIVGAGAAGLIAALNVRGRRVCILSPDGNEVADTASDYAQGGIAAAVGPDDTSAQHLHDTLAAGHNQGLVSAARVACHEALGSVKYLESLGVKFASDSRGLLLHTEAAHGRARVLYVDGDATGAAIMRVLRSRVAETSGVEVLSGTRAVSLLCDAGGVRGVAAMTANGQPLMLRARAVVIATGGVGGLYSRTTNPTGACGDGVAMALAAGANCNALEFVQFHPTALDVDTRPLPLMTEALRGAGASLIDESGTSIMRKIHPLADLAPRDVIARTIYAEQSAGRRVWLDATRLVDDDLSVAFPSAYKRCCEHGIDPRHEPIPVTPAAHYHMGGIAVDLEGRTSLPGLWAVGEAACTGMHGANRLASNSLLEAVVFGRRVGRALSRERNRPADASSPPHMMPIEAPEKTCGRTLQAAMWRCMGLVRSAVRLAEGLVVVERLREQTAVHAILERSRLLLAQRMMLAATRRVASCGAHYRSDADSSVPGYLLGGGRERA